MKRLLTAEFIKMQWLIVGVLITADVWVGSSLGIMQLDSLKEFFVPNWSTLYMYMVYFHAMFFYPLYCGILASLICLYEHRHGGWKLLLALPLSRNQVYYSKFILLIGILAVIQLVFLISYLVTGTIVAVPGDIVWSSIGYSIIGGWVAMMPLAALQLWLSTKIKSFGAAQVFNICCVVPNIVVTGLHSSFGAWFPFSPPYYIMMPQTASYAPGVETYSLITIIVITFVLYFTFGKLSFVRRDWI
ncbi:lantibiotic ABC transporter permease [Paenibacillus glucanolyticus]|uniref:Lantibiotic ABC transporter permease n=1 Tax=Paenibacillus glucanolyticus TaxID=59843 RepID=A0A163DK78_9BACL|nr:ABC transporter permease [Paenibacillus glucanolyticus]KZS43283.1 lantibiotic ABC transporter permease [Paenibacillus glucanolyticus]